MMETDTEFVRFTCPCGEALSSKIEAGKVYRCRCGKTYKIVYNNSWKQQTDARRTHTIDRRKAGPL